ncbi:MAG: helix-turn-helix domain-containing protein [Planctomycetota bacterium]
MFLRLTQCGITPETVGDTCLQRWTHSPVPLPCWRLYWNPEPGSQLRLGRRCWQMGPDRLQVIAPETVYSAMGPERPHQHLFVHFSVHGYDWQTPTGIHEQPVDAIRAGLIAALRQAMVDQDPDRVRLQACALCTHALAALPPPWRRASRHAPPIRRTLDHLQAHPDRRIGNEELARIAGMSVNAFIRSFRRSTSCSPQAWHQRHRIQRAGLELLRGVDIDAVAETFGFCDRHHFSRVFARLRGIAPAAWRRAVTAHESQEAPGAA